MPSVSLVVNVAGESEGVPGQSRTFPYSKISGAGALVTVSLSDNTGITSYFWEIVDKPPGSTAVLSDATASAPTFTATHAEPGTYLIRCTVNGGQSFGTIGVAFTTDTLALRKIAAGETTEFDAQKGWSVAINDIIEAAESFGSGAVSGVIRSDGSVAFEGDQSLGGNKLTDLAAGTEDNDAATYAQVVAASLSGSSLYGFPNFKEDSTLSFEPIFSEWQFTISPVDTTFDVWVGTKFSLTEQTLLISGDSGYHWIYFNSDGILTEVVNPDEVTKRTLYRETALVAIIYWISPGTWISMSDERHGTLMDGASRYNLHTTISPKYMSGFDLGDFLPDEDGSVIAHAQFSVSSGSFSDEDLIHDLEEQSSTAAWFTYFKNGAGVWERHINPDVKKCASAIKYFSLGEAFLSHYNLNSEGTWSLEPIPNEKYFMVHVFATSDPDRPFISVVARSYHSILSKAFSSARDDIIDILADLPFPECIPIASVCYRSYRGDTFVVSLNSDGVTTHIDWREDTHEGNVILKDGVNVGPRFPGDSLKLSQYSSDSLLDRAFIINGISVGDSISEPSITFTIDDDFWASIEVYGISGELGYYNNIRFLIPDYFGGETINIANFGERQTILGCGGSDHELIIDGDDYSELGFYSDGDYRCMFEYSLGTDALTVSGIGLGGGDNYLWITPGSFYISNAGYYDGCVGIQTSEQYDETGTYVVDSFEPYRDAGGCEWLYVAANDSGASEIVRTGRIHVAYNMADSLLDVNEVVGSEIGTSTDITFDVAINGSSVELKATNSLGSWRITTYLLNMDSSHG